MESYKRAIIGVAVIIAVGTVAFFLFFSGEGSKEDPTPNSRKGIKPVQETKKEEPLPVPAEPVIKEDAANPQASLQLNKSDSTVKDELETCSDSKVFASILGNEDLIRKFTATILNISRGKSPAKHLPFMKPGKDFSVKEKNGITVLNINSYKRYNFVAALFESLNTERALTGYEKLKPLFRKAMAELGLGNTSFETVLQKAFTVLLKTPLVYGDIRLEKKLKSWEYTDLKLAKLNEAQKHLFRMGPENIKKIHSKIREFGKTLNMENLPVTKSYIPSN